MPARALVFALLLSCNSLAAMALSSMEEPLRDLPMRGIPTLTISSVHWKKQANTTLQLCVTEDISAGQATLVWGDTVQGGSQDIDEEVDDGEANCSTFQMSSSFSLSVNPTFYQLIIKDVSGGGGVLFAGSITFAMTAKTSILSCGDLKVTKLSWATESPITYDGCIGTEGTSFDTDCYIEESFSNTDLCFNVTNPLVTVCLNGPIDDVASGGQLSVNYLAYGEPADLSLNYAGQGMGNMRAIVRLADDPASPGQPGQATVYDCTGGLCPLIAGSPPVYETYEVCGEARAANGHSQQTATAKIIDLNLFVFVGGTDVLEFAFANGLENGMYTASLFYTAPPPGDTPLNTISVDCTDVEAGHACFGFFITPTNGTLYVALSEKRDDSNKIIATYTEQPPEQAQVHSHGPQFNDSVRTKLPS